MEEGTKTVNFSSNPSECRIICETPKLDKTVCKHGSSCHVKTHCKAGHCLCSMTIKCYPEGAKKKLDTTKNNIYLSAAEEKNKIEEMMKELKSSPDEKTITVTRDDCTGICLLSYLEENMCDSGMSCTAKSECMKSVPASCNCSMTLKCHESDGTKMSNSNERNQQSSSLISSSNSTTRFASEIDAFKALSETADQGQRTVSFNTTKEQCNRVCSSPKLANICQQGATCKIRSECESNFDCICSVTLTCQLGQNQDKLFRQLSTTKDFENDSPKDSNGSYPEKFIISQLKKSKGSLIRTVSFKLSHDLCSETCGYLDLGNVIFPGRTSSCMEEWSECTTDNKSCNCTITIEGERNKSEQFENSKNQSNAETSMVQSMSNFTLEFRNKVFTLQEVSEFLQKQNNSETKQVIFKSSKDVCKGICEELKTVKGICSDGATCEGESTCTDNLCTCHVTLTCKSQADSKTDQQKTQKRIAGQRQLQLSSKGDDDDMLNSEQGRIMLDQYNGKSSLLKGDRNLLTNQSVNDSDDNKMSGSVHLAPERKKVEESGSVDVIGKRQAVKENEVKQPKDDKTVIKENEKSTDNQKSNENAAQDETSSNRDIVEENKSEIKNENSNGEQTSNEASTFEKENARTKLKNETNTSNGMKKEADVSEKENHALEINKAKAKDNQAEGNVGKPEDNKKSIEENERNIQSNTQSDTNTEVLADKKHDEKYNEEETKKKYEMSNQDASESSSKDVKISDQGKAPTTESLEKESGIKKNQVASKHAKEDDEIDKIIKETEDKDKPKDKNRKVENLERNDSGKSKNESEDEKITTKPDKQIIKSNISDPFGHNESVPKNINPEDIKEQAEKVNDNSNTDMKTKTDIANNDELDQSKNDKNSEDKTAKQTNVGKEKDERKETFEGHEHIGRKKSGKEVEDKMGPSKTDIEEKKDDLRAEGKTEDDLSGKKSALKDGDPLKTIKDFEDKNDNQKTKEEEPNEEKKKVEDQDEIKVSKSEEKNIASKDQPRTDRDLKEKKDNQTEKEEEQENKKITSEVHKSKIGKKSEEKEELNNDQLTNKKYIEEKKDNQTELEKENDHGNTALGSQENMNKNKSGKENEETSKTVEVKNPNEDDKIEKKKENEPNVNEEVEKAKLETTNNNLNSKIDNSNDDNLLMPKPDRADLDKNLIKADSKLNKVSMDLNKQEKENNIRDTPDLENKHDISQAAEHKKEQKDGIDDAHKNSSNSNYNVGLKEESLNMNKANNSKALKETQNDHERKILEKEQKLQALKVSNMPAESKDDRKENMAKYEDSKSNDSFQKKNKIHPNVNQEGQTENKDSSEMSKTELINNDKATKDEKDSATEMIEDRKENDGKINETVSNKIQEDVNEGNKKSNLEKPKENAVSEAEISENKENKQSDVDKMVKEEPNTNSSTRVKEQKSDEETGNSRTNQHNSNDELKKNSNSDQNEIDLKSSDGVNKQVSENQMNISKIGENSRNTEEVDIKGADIRKITSKVESNHNIGKPDLEKENNNVEDGIKLASVSRSEKELTSVNSSNSSLNDCSELCKLTQLEDHICRGGFSCLAQTNCSSQTNCTCTLTVTCRGVEQSFLRKSSNTSTTRSSKHLNLSGIGSEETRIIETLRVIEMKGQKTINFNASKPNCKQLCDSPKLAQNICQYGSACKVKSSDCADNSVCNCSLTLTCLEVNEEFKNLLEMDAKTIKANAVQNKKISKKGLVSTIVKFRVGNRTQCSESCKPMIAGACSSFKPGDIKKEDETVKETGKCKYVFQCTGRGVHEFCKCSVKATCDTNKTTNNSEVAQIVPEEVKSVQGLEGDYSTGADESKSSRSKKEQNLIKQFESIRENGTKTVYLDGYNIKDCRSFCEHSSKISHDTCLDESICSTTCLDQDVSEEKRICKNCSLTLTCSTGKIDVSHVRAMSLDEIKKIGKTNLKSDGTTEVQFKVNEKSECAESCRALIEGACAELGGICDFLIQCSGKEAKQSCICSTKGVCHPADAEGAKKGLKGWKKNENMKNNGPKLVYEFSSSKKVNQSSSSAIEESYRRTVKADSHQPEKEESKSKGDSTTEESESSVDDKNEKDYTYVEALSSVERSIKSSEKLPKKISKDYLAQGEIAQANSKEESSEMSQEETSGKSQEESSEMSQEETSGKSQEESSEMSQEKSSEMSSEKSPKMIHDYTNKEDKKSSEKINLSNLESDIISAEKAS